MNIPLLTSLPPGDIIVADDDGVVVVPAADIAETLAAAEKRQAAKTRNGRNWHPVRSDWTFMKCVQRLKRLAYAMSRNLRTSE